MRKFALIVLVVLAAAWLAVELVAPPLAESQIAERVATSTEGVTGVDADVGTFPVVTRFLLTGEVRDVEVTLNEVARQQLEFTTVTFGLTGVELDRNAAVNGQVDIRDAEAAVLTAALAVPDLADSLGLPVELEGADLQPEVSGRQLTLGDAAVSLPSDLVPCEPDARVEGDRVVLTCTLDEVPGLLLRAFQ